MAARGKKELVIYLEDWQKRMVKVVCGNECDVIAIPLDGSERGLRYGVGPPVGSADERMYLTEWQMRQIRDEAGQACEFIELATTPVSRYGVPAE